MAQRPGGYGMTAELANKINPKYDAQSAQEAMDWIADTLEEANLSDEAGRVRGKASSKEIEEALKDGSILCKFINVVEPGSVKINESKMVVKQMENINNFLSAMAKYGVEKAESFSTVDLFEGQNMPAVVSGLHALKGRIQGPKHSDENPREFTDEAMRAGESVIGLRGGYPKGGAGQAGQNFGKTRPYIARAEVHSTPIAAIGFNSSFYDAGMGLAMIGMIAAMLVGCRRRRQRVAEDDSAAVLE